MKKKTKKKAHKKIASKKRVCFATKPIQLKKNDACIVLRADDSVTVFLPKMGEDDLVGGNSLKAFKLLLVFDSPEIQEQLDILMEEKLAAAAEPEDEKNTIDPPNPSTNS